ncbi:MAG: PrsW family intramembrane metalloprotease [Parcubacteria group bacterium]|nr:PrsW family intramembrane metalloprotease [Parcubacteria group bacterium]
MAGSLTISNTLWSLFGGLLPALVWLWFWLREDPHPEPRKMLLLVFFGGAAAVPFALFFERFAFRIGVASGLVQPGTIGVGLLVVWAFIEEYLKYLAAKKIALERRVYDEPVDAIIYLITAALGFAALENMLFLLRAFGETGVLLGITTTNLRFLGATLLHVIASSVIGISVAFSFFHTTSRTHNLRGGLYTATALHALFNIFIMEKGDDAIFFIFTLLWLAALVVIFFFERVKSLQI